MAQISINGSSAGTALMDILTADDIQPGSEPSYSLCKTIFLTHPLGRKMTESPVAAAQSQERIVTVPNSPEDRVVRAFKDEWKRIDADRIIRGVATLARVYGVASLGLMSEKTPIDEPVDFAKIAKADISFNTFDPLNTAGSLVLNQNPNAIDFLKYQGITVSGRTMHRSRCAVLMNEQPIYLGYTVSAFGYVGRSVFQRALFPLKSFLQTMLTDDLVTVKAGVLVAKLASPGSIVDNLMDKLFGLKRQLIKEAATGNVLSIGPEDAIDTLNFKNLDGPYGQVRTNILKNIATAADMPAVMLENETLTEGFGEGTEDAKTIAAYIRTIREWMQPLYAFFDNIVQYRAWNEEFYETITADFPDYKSIPYQTAFYAWRNSFTAAWPNLLEEPDSEKAKAEKAKLEAIERIVNVLLPALDPENKALLIQWVADNLNDMKVTFTEPFDFDMDAMLNYVPETPALGAGDGGEDGARRVDAATIARMLPRLPKAAAG